MDTNQDENELRFRLSMIKVCCNLSINDQALFALNYAKTCLDKCNQEDVELMRNSIEELAHIVAKKQQTG